MTTLVWLTVLCLMAQHCAGADTTPTKPAKPTTSGGTKKPTTSGGTKKPTTSGGTAKPTTSGGTATPTTSGPTGGPTSPPTSSKKPPITTIHPVPPTTQPDTNCSHEVNKNWKIYWQYLPDKDKYNTHLRFFFKIPMGEAKDKVWGGIGFQTNKGKTVDDQWNIIKMDGTKKPSMVYATTKKGAPNVPSIVEQKFMPYGHNMKDGLFSVHWILTSKEPDDIFDYDDPTHKNYVKSVTLMMTKKLGTWKGKTLDPLIKEDVLVGLKVYPVMCIGRGYGEDIAAEKPGK